MADQRKYGTTFFESYAQISLEHLLGRDYATLVNRDRPDLQTPDGRTLGIEVTRAMEENKNAADMLLKEMSGVVLLEDDRLDFEEIRRSGYAYGLQGGNYIGHTELPYWSLAQPLARILESKVSKAGNGFYGEYESLGLYVFCKDSLALPEILKTCRYVLDLQMGQDVCYDTLYLSEIGTLHVCNLRDNIATISDRVASYDIPVSLRREFYLKAVRTQLSV